MMSEKHNVSELVAQSEEFVRELKNHCVDDMFSRKYSWRAKHPYKVMSFVNAMTWRMYDMSCAALTLLKQNNIIPALSLVRACWENMVATYELAGLVKDCCEKQIIDGSIDDTLMRIFFRIALRRTTDMWEKSILSSSRNISPKTY